MKQILALSAGIVKKILIDVLRIATVLLFVGFFVNSLEPEEAEDWNQCP